MLFEAKQEDVVNQLKKEKIKAVEQRAKRIKRRLAEKALTHEAACNFGIPMRENVISTNKARLNRMEEDLKKNIQLRDVDNIEQICKDVMRLLETKRETDLNIMRQTRIVHMICDCFRKVTRNEFEPLARVLPILIRLMETFTKTVLNKT